MKLIDHTVTMSRREIVRGLALGSVVVLAPGCAYNEELGRSQLLFVSSDQMAQLASSAWTDLKKQEKTTSDPKYVNRVKRVAPRIIQASGNNPSAWEVQVFDSKQLNAFALPGGKIGFYTGILDIMDNDDQIACVMGHEVAHVNYNHSGERYSQSTLAQTGLTVAQVAVGDSRYQSQIMGVLGMGASLGVILPYSRKHELEADKFGLRYMHRAGYNPDEAIKFWQKMSSQKSGAPPEILSTHPSDATRIAQLQREIALIRQGGAS
ncbi:MAG: M48 family metallopeptidase [Pseudomonadota bacterium]|nr:M48 family metallopeptidase [Pseudomonadota bacterium]